MRNSRFREEQEVMLKNYYKGIPEGKGVTVVDPRKDNKKRITVRDGDKIIKVPTKYLKAFK